ncbi:MAG: hypothetical protein KAV82_05430 [Phycisphaerae bacterium]|nr:hypothetical protein [Phycisphaerae bacterium]
MMQTTMRSVLGLLLGIACAVASISATAEDPKSKPSSKPTTQAKEQHSPSGGEDDSSTRTPPGVSAEDLLDAFQKDRPTRVPITPSGEYDEKTTEHDARGSGISQRLPDGFFLVDRVGRVTKDGDWYVFVFEGYSESHPEPPMKLLPNQLLERMALEAEGTADSPTFIISGEVTEFKSENYLLLRKLLRRRNLGNLEK